MAAGMLQLCCQELPRVQLLLFLSLLLFPRPWRDTQAPSAGQNLLLFMAKAMLLLSSMPRPWGWHQPRLEWLLGARGMPVVVMLGFAGNCFPGWGFCTRGLFHPIIRNLRWSWRPFCAPAASVSGAGWAQCWGSALGSCTPKHHWRVNFWAGSLPALAVLSPPAGLCKRSPAEARSAG